MHWTLPQVHALTANQHAALVQWLTDRQSALDRGGPED